MDECPFGVAMGVVSVVLGGVLVSWVRFIAAALEIREERFARAGVRVAIEVFGALEIV